MTASEHYFYLARTEEKHNNLASALLLYLSSFCACYNSNDGVHPCGAVAKISKLQREYNLSDFELSSLVKSYGPLSDHDCSLLLIYAIQGNLSGIRLVTGGVSWKN